jgi:hypothetical protein
MGVSVGSISADISSLNLHAADKRIVDIVLIQIFDEIACTNRSAFVCPELVSFQLTQTRKSQHCQIQFEQEVSFLGRFSQRVPDIALPFSFRFRINDFDSVLLHLDFLVLEFGHLETKGLEKLTKSEDQLREPHPSL